MSRNIMPSWRSIAWRRNVKAHTNVSTEASIMTPKSMMLMPSSTRGLTSDDMPSMPKMLKMFDPNTLPSASCGARLVAANDGEGYHFVADAPLPGNIDGAVKEEVATE